MKDTTTCTACGESFDDRGIGNSLLAIMGGSNLTVRCPKCATEIELSAREPDKARTKFYKGMPEAERLAAVDEFLLWIRSGRAKAEAKAKVDPEWEAKYGEAAWRAALVQLGLPEDYDEPAD